MAISDLISAKKSYDKGEVQAAGDALTKFYWDTYDGWTERRSKYPPLKELQAAGFQDIAAISAFEREVVPKALNLNLIEAKKSADAGDLPLALKQVSSAIYKAYRVGLDLSNNRSEIPLDLPEIYANTGFGNAEDVLSFMDLLRDQIIAANLEGFKEAIDAGDYKQAFDIMTSKNVAGTINTAQPLTSYLVKERSITVSAITLYAEKQGVSAEKIQQAVAQTFLYDYLARQYENIYEPAGAKLTGINKKLKENGFSSYDDVPQSIKTAIDQKIGTSFEKELDRMSIVADMSSVASNRDISDSAMLKSPSRLNNFAKAAGSASIFAMPSANIFRFTLMGDEADTYAAQYKDLMHEYRDRLAAADNGQYPRAAVLKDYYNAGAKGADLTFDTRHERLDLLVDQSLQRIGLKPLERAFA